MPRLASHRIADRSAQASGAPSQASRRPAGMQLVILDAVVEDESSRAEERKGHPSPAPEGEGGFGDLRQYVPRDMLDVSFPASVRGYDRRAVDAYVKRANRVIAELKVSASPPAAVRHALDQAGEKVDGLLQAAREAAEEITASARQEAEESTARAKAEAAQLIVSTSSDADRMKAEADELVARNRAEADAILAAAKAEADELRSEATAEANDTRARSGAEAEENRRRLQEELAALREQAETRMGEIHGDTEAIWKQRHQLLDDMRAMAAGLLDLADAAAARIEPAQLPAGGEKPPGLETEAEPPGVTNDVSEAAPPAPSSEEDGDDPSPHEDTKRSKAKSEF
jgi:cell division septum initiation protein DivIVA